MVIYLATVCIFVWIQENEWKCYFRYTVQPSVSATSSPGLFPQKMGGALSQWYGHPRVLGIPIPISLAFWASPVGDAQNADRFDFA